MAYVNIYFGIGMLMLLVAYVITKHDFSSWRGREGYSELDEFQREAGDIFLRAFNTPGGILLLLIGAAILWLPALLWVLLGKEEK